MFWDEEDLVTRLVKSVPTESPLHRSETISVFGSTDVAADVGARSLARAASGNLSPGPENTNATAWAAHQAAVPPLPVPDLHETCKLYLQSLEGLVNAEEYIRSQTCVEEFLTPGGVGEELQKRLLEHAAKNTGPSWFQGFWDDAYLCTRDPNPINVNYFFGFMRHPQHSEFGSQLGRATTLVHAAATFYKMIHDRDLPLDTERGQPLCMSQYRRVFCSSRVPKRDRDYIVTYTDVPLTEDEKKSKTTLYVKDSPRHIVVLIRNRFYAVDVLSASGDVESVDTICRRLALVLRSATGASKQPGVPVGLFTTLDRDDWADCRDHLVQLGNEGNLVAIQRSLFVLALDAVEASGLDELARVLLHGPGTNRWFDRHNIIVTANGEAGINFEHSVGDGITTLRVADFMYRSDADHGLHSDRVAEIRASVEKTHLDTTGVQEIVWQVDDVVDRWLKDAFEHFTELIRSNETTTLNFQHYGGDFVKKAGVSPDAFVQLAFQLTHYRLFGRVEATYEAASTRAFSHGRTEVVRSVTRAATDFCEASNQPVFSRRINSKVPSQMQLLKNAADAHVNYMKQAKVARGVDRHMLGLRRMCAQHGIPMPSIFTDPSFSRSSHWVLSTSHCGSSALCLFGFGPVVNDGFGLGYMIKNDSISCCVTSKYTHRLMSSSIFASMLDSSLLQMKAIVECDWERRQQQRPRSLDFVHPTAYADFDYHEASGFRYQRVRRSIYSPGSSLGARRGSVATFQDPQSAVMSVAHSSASQ